MKYLKKFETKKSEEILFDCDKFRIIYSKNNSFSMLLKSGNVIMREFSAIPAMAELIRDDAKEIIDPNLRKIKIRQKDINEEIDAITLYEKKINNIKQFRTGYMKHFLEQSVRISLTEDTYMDVDDEIDTHRQDERYKKDFTITQSLRDFKKFHSDLKKVVKKMQSKEFKIKQKASKYNIL